MSDQDHSFAVIETKGLWLYAVYPIDILRLNEVMLTRLPASTGGNIEEGVIIKDRVSTGNGTTIRSCSYFVGPMAIGDNCEIGPSVCIFPATSIGNNVS